MDVRPGYKQTEVGVIPEDWCVVCASDACLKIQDGTHFSPRLGGNDHLYITSKNIRFGYLDISSALRIDVNQHRAIYKRCDVKKGDLLFTKDGVNTGNAALNTLDEEFSLLSSVAFLRFDANKHNAAYFFQQILSSQGQRQIQDAMAGNAITRLTLEKIKKLRFPAPPTLAEQKAIAEALGDADALIESLEQLIAKKRHLKRGAMQELLTGKRRLPGFENKPGYKQAEVGVLPEDWEVTRLGDLFEITSSKRVFQSEWKTEGVPFYRAREIAVLGEKGFVDNDLFISRQMYDAFRRAHGVPRVGDLLVTGVGTLGKVYVVPDDREFYFKDGNIIWFKIAGAIYPAYLRQLYLMPVVVKQIADASAGTTVGTYTISGAKKTIIPLPTKTEQEAIAEILSDMDGEIAMLEEKLTKARQIKQGMMQELLTGRIRLV